MEARALTATVKALPSAVNESHAQPVEQGIRIWDTSYLQDLVHDLPVDSPPPTTAPRLSPPRTRKPPWGISADQMKAPKPKNEQASRQKLEQHWLLTQQMEKERAKRTQERLIETKEREEIRFNESMQALNRESPLIASIRNTVNQHAQEEQRRKEEVYRGWCKKVFDPIQSQIQNVVNSRSVSEIEAQRRQAHDDFLAIGNKKPEGLFRDIVIKDLYDPFKYAPNVAAYSHDDFHQVDPTLQDIAKIHHERLGSDSGAASYFKPRLRQGSLDVKLWDKVECTPYGHYLDESGRVNTRITQSNCTFDHYKVERDSAPAYEERFHGGKKIYASRRKGMQSTESLDKLNTERKHVTCFDALMHTREMQAEPRGGHMVPPLVRASGGGGGSASSGGRSPRPIPVSQP